MCIFVFIGNEAYRTKEGSWFIRTLCQNLRLCAEKETLQDILIRTTRDVAKRNGIDEKGVALKQVPDKKHDSITKKIQLCPKGSYSLASDTF